MSHRIRRRIWGGLLEVKVFKDGSLRVWFDHPSNDPEVEFAAVGRSLRMLRDLYAANGMAVDVGPAQWRDDA